MYLTEGKRLLQSQPRDGIFHHTLRRLPKLLTKSSWDPGWLKSTRRAEISSPEETYSKPEMVLTWCPQETKRPGLGRWLRHTAHLGQCAGQAPGRLSCSDLGRAQNACPTESVPCGVPENLNPSGLDLRSAWNPGPALDSVLQSTPQPEQCRTRKHKPWAWANPVWSIHCKHSPHTPVIIVCRVPPSPKHNWTSESK